MNTTDTMNFREIARKLASDALARGRPLDWFEELYQLAETTSVPIPWADRKPNPNLVDLVQRLPPISPHSRALKVGCGWGDDAEWMASRGWQTTAFDIAPTAIAKCRARFPASAVSYQTADLFDPPAEWRRAFDVVQESYTLQVLPPELRPGAIAHIANFVKPGGRLLLITRSRLPDEPTGAMPWPLTETEIAAFSDHGLTRSFFRHYTDTENPRVPRIQACFTREANSDMVQVCPKANATTAP